MSASLQRVSRGFGALGIALALWGFFYPRPLLILVLLLATSPIIAVLVTIAYDGEIAPFDEPANRYGLATYAIMCPIVLGLVELRAFPLVSGWRLLLIGVVAGTALGILYLWVRPLRFAARKPLKRDLVIGWLSVAIYGWILVAAFNGLGPQGVSSTYPEEVLAMHISSGKGTSYYLRLPPVGPINSAEDWSIDPSLYGSVKVGDRVCMIIHRGALAESWYEARLCK